jgi:hypothetical protein
MTFDDKILNIEFEDDDGEYEEFQNYINNYNERSKNQIAKEVNLIGDQMLRELEAKKKIEHNKKMELIPYILSKSKDGYTEEQLLSYSITDIRLMYNEIKIQRKNRSFFNKIIEFIFNF